MWEDTIALLIVVVSTLTLARRYILTWLLYFGTFRKNDDASVRNRTLDRWCECDGCVFGLFKNRHLPEDRNVQCILIAAPGEKILR